MAGKRAFSGDDIPTKTEDYHGTARYVRTPSDVLEKGVKSLNIDLEFEEALKLSLAIQSCIMHLNKYNRRETAGREMGLSMSIKTDSNTITVIEKPVRPDK